jgi:hypothetical protein
MVLIPDSIIPNQKKMTFSFDQSRKDDEFIRHNLVREKQGNLNLITNMDDVSEVYKTIWRAMSKFDYTVRNPYNPDIDKTCSVKTFIKHNGGVCEDFASYMHFRFGKPFHKVFFIGWEFIIDKVSKALYGIKRDHIFSGHIFIVYNKNVLIELANPKMLGVLQFPSEKVLVQQVRDNVYEQAVKPFKLCGWKINSFISEYIPDDSEMVHNDFFEYRFAHDKNIEGAFK